MKVLPFAVFCYFAFHSYLLKAYSYSQLSGHMIYIILLQLYLVFYKQSPSYVIPQQSNTQKNNTKNELFTAPNQNQPPKICLICKNIKPSRYYHCRRCNICIYRMDHHCHWIGNCIGQYNSKPYFHLLFNLFIHSLIVIGYIFVWDFHSITQNHDRKIYLWALVLPMVFILYETQRLLKDFYSMISINQTLIESYKGVRGRNQSIFKNIGQFFGTSLMLLWCLPTYLPFEKTQKSSDLLEKTVRMQTVEKEPEQLTFADEYLYGKDDDEQHHGHNCSHNHTH